MTIVPPWGGPDIYAAERHANLALLSLEAYFF